LELFLENPGWNRSLLAPRKHQAAGIVIALQLKSFPTTAHLCDGLGQGDAIGVSRAWRGVVPTAAITLDSR
jgi:hypothetical protein